MTKEKQINILMQDHLTSREAENYVKNHTADIYEDPAKFIQMLKDNDWFYGETLEDIRARKVSGVSMVKYEDHEYLISYCL